MEKFSLSKSNFFQKSPEISFAESPALSFLRGGNKSVFGGGNNFTLNKRVSNGSICKPSPCLSSLMPTPLNDPINFLGKGSCNWLIDSKPLNSIKLDFVPIGSPEIN